MSPEAAAFTSPSTGAAPSRREKSLWTWRWTNSVTVIPMGVFALRGEGTALSGQRRGRSPRKATDHHRATEAQRVTEEDRALLRQGPSPMPRRSKSSAPSVISVAPCPCGYPPPVVPLPLRCGHEILPPLPRPPRGLLLGPPGADAAGRVGGHRRGDPRAPAPDDGEALRGDAERRPLPAAGVHKGGAGLLRNGLDRLQAGGPGLGGAAPEMVGHGPRGDGAPRREPLPGPRGEPGERGAPAGRGGEEGAHLHGRGGGPRPRRGPGGARGEGRRREGGGRRPGGSPRRRRGGLPHRPPRGPRPPRHRGERRAEPLEGIGLGPREQRRPPCRGDP